MIPNTFRMTNSTELVRKHKNEYLKAGKKEIAFDKVIRGLKEDKYLFDEKTGKLLVSAELQKEAYETAPEIMRKMKELAEHQEINKRNPEYQVLKDEKKAHKKALRQAKRKQK